jgi:radical SAM superfamily enzyme YgiQ (UPF0313 family)
VSKLNQTLQSESHRLDLLLLGDSSATIGWGRYAGIYRIASEARSAGYSVRVFDHFITIFSDPLFKRSLETFILEKRPRVVGLSSTFMKRYLQNKNNQFVSINEVFAEEYEDVQVLPFGIDNEIATDFLNWLRGLGILIVLGGSEDKTIYQEFPIDHFVVGQGEISIVEILKRARGAANFDRLPKIMHQDEYRYDKFNESKIIWDAEDVIFQGEALPIELARGCIFKCAFCNFQLNGKSKNEFVKIKDALVQELLHNFHYFGTTDYIISDDLLNDSLEKVTLLRDIALTLPFKLSFTSYLRLDLLWRYPEMIGLLKDAGLKACYFGIETFNDKAGRAVGKGLGEKRIKTTLEAARKAWGDSVWISVGLIIGLPHEPLSSCEKTIDWLLQSGSPVDFFKLSPLIVYNSAQASSQVFGVRAESLGYKVITGRFFATWENEEMNYSDSVKFSLDFYAKTDPRKWKYAHFCSYNRVMNLGYPSGKRILDVLHDDLGTRKDKMIRTYLSRAFDPRAFGSQAFDLVQKN